MNDTDDLDASLDVAQPPELEHVEADDSDTSSDDDAEMVGDGTAFEDCGGARHVSYARSASAPGAIYELQPVGLLEVRIPSASFSASYFCGEAARADESLEQQIAESPIVISCSGPLPTPTALTLGLQPQPLADGARRGACSMSHSSSSGLLRPQRSAHVHRLHRVPGKELLPLWARRAQHRLSRPATAVHLLIPPSSLPLRKPPRPFPAAEHAATAAANAAATSKSAAAQRLSSAPRGTHLWAAASQATDWSAPLLRDAGGRQYGIIARKARSPYGFPARR